MIMRARAICLLFTLCCNTPVIAQDWTIEAVPCVALTGSIDVFIFADSGPIQQYACSFNFAFDPTVFELDTTLGTRGGLDGCNWNITVNYMLAPGVFRAIGIGDDQTGRSHVCTFRFRRIAGAGPTMFSGVVDVWADPSLSDIRPGGSFAMIPTSVDLGCGSAPSCIIRIPNNQPQGRTPVLFQFDTWDADMHGLDIFYEFDTGGGFLPATRLGGGSSIDLGVLPTLGLTFNWNAPADLAGSPGAVCATFRVRVVDPTLQSGESVRHAQALGDNSCLITSPGSGATIPPAVQIIQYNVWHVSSLPVTVSYEFNLGAGWLPATRAGGGPSSDIGVPTPSFGRTFNWDVAADIAIPFTGVRFRLRVNDGAGPSGNCEITVDVSALAGPPTCGIVSPPSGMLTSAAQIITFNAVDPNFDPIDITYEFDAGSGFQPASRVGGGPAMDFGVTPAAGLTFDWNLAADFTSATPGVQFRITVDDRVSGSSTCNSFYDIDPFWLNSPPTCAIVSPPAGTVISGAALLTYDCADLDGDPLTIAHEFDIGAGFLPATRFGGGSSIDTGVLPGAGLTFNWDALSDVPAGMAGVRFRVALDDGRSGSGDCEVMVDVLAPNGPPSCGLTSPIAGAVLGGATLMTFNAIDPDGDLLTITYEYDAGAGLVPASRTGGGSSVDTGVLPASGLTFDWDVPADLPGPASSVMFVITVDDSVSGASNCTVIVDYDVFSCPVLVSQCGDCNQDGQISILDALIASRISAGLVVATPAQFDRCNVIGPVSPSPVAAVNILDALAMAQASASLPVTFACC